MCVHEESQHDNSGLLNVSASAEFSSNLGAMKYFVSFIMNECIYFR